MDKNVEQLIDELSKWTDEDWERLRRLING